MLAFIEERESNAGTGNPAAGYYCYRPSERRIALHRRCTSHEERFGKSTYPLPHKKSARAPLGWPNNRRVCCKPCGKPGSTMYVFTATSAFPAQISQSELVSANSGAKAERPARP